MKERRHVIMMIDDDETYLATGGKILEKRFTVYPVTSGGAAIAILKKIEVDLILLDIEMPGMNGYEVIQRLKQDSQTSEIPVIFLTSRTDPGYELEGLSLGAIDYVTKPFSPSLLMQRIDNHLLISSQKKELLRFNHSLQEMVDEQTEEIRNLQNAILNTVSELVEFRDEMSGGHVERILQYIRRMIEEMLKQGLYADVIESWDIEAFINAAQMHDVGKICISETILNKRGKVSRREFEEIMKHPGYGLMIIDRIREMTGEHLFLDYAEIFAESHHERWDGSGYPEGRKEQDIPLAGRLMAIADVYDALVSDRPYKQPMIPREAKKEIIRGSGTAFDPVLVEIFKTVSGDFAKIAERRDTLI